jgi:hypothetical protein
MGYSVVNVDEIEGSGPGGARPVRPPRAGPGSLRDQLVRAATGRAGHERHEADSGQEEINLVVAGSDFWRVDGQEVPAKVGTFLRFDPDTTRQPVAGPDGMTFIGVGARRGSYEPRGPF